MNKYLNPKKYINFILRKMSCILVPVIKLWEYPYIKKYSYQPLKHQPVFIIGAPRTGSTILYQTITNQLDVLYVDNLVCKFYSNFFFGFWLSNKLFKQRAHNCFKSKHGSTKGLHAPSECGAFWYRWLPKDRHFIDYNDITDKMVKEIKREIATIINYYNKPIVFKNLNTGQRMRLIQRCFPNAKFIFIKRDPLFTAQSILKAKRQIGLAANEFWSVMPPNVAKLKRYNSSEQVIKQIFYIEKQIVVDAALFPQKNMLIMNYNNLKDQDPFNQCQSFCGAKNKNNYSVSNICLSEKLTLPATEICQLKSEICKLDWDNYVVK